MKDKTGKTRKETKVKSLPCALSEEERLERGAALAAVVISIANHEKDLAERSDDFKLEKKEIESKVSKAKTRLSELSDVVSEGSEKRDVDCESTFDYEAGTVIVRRLDIYEVIEDRELQGLEKQMQLDWEQEHAQEDGEVVTIDKDAVVCADCDGAGQLPPDGDTCDTCKGQGVPVIVCESDHCQSADGGCDECDGKGYVLASEAETTETDGEESD